MPFMMKLPVQHTRDTFLTLTNSNYLTKHITLKLFPFLLIERSLSISFTTGIFTRANHLRINKFNLPYKFQNFAIDFMVILTRMILYNCMIVNGSYHKFFTFTEQSHLL